MFHVLGKKSEEDASLAFVATRCLCELLVAKTHFNFRLEIMVAVVTRMSTVKWNEAAQLCSETLITIFESDESGRSSLDAVKMIIRMVKSKGFADTSGQSSVLTRVLSMPSNDSHVFIRWHRPTRSRGHPHRIHFFLNYKYRRQAHEESALCCRTPCTSGREWNVIKARNIDGHLPSFALSAAPSILACRKSETSQGRLRGRDP